MSPHMNSSKRIAIVGSAGRLGALLADTLEEQNQTVIRLGRDQLDIGSVHSISRALEPLRYDMLIITGALTAVDYCETHEKEAYSVNGLGPGKIAEISAAKGAHVTYISTDFVYDGVNPSPYTEEDRPNPVSVYGASKLKGEELVLAASDDNLVLRIAWLYGPGKAAFPEWIINKACAEKDLTLPGDKTGCPTSSADLVDWMLALLFRPEGKPASGVFNLCNSNPCTWREWGQHCLDTARSAGLPLLAREIRGVPVDSVEAFVAKRPVNSAMSTDKFFRATGIAPRDWRDAVSDFLHHSELFEKQCHVSPAA